MDIVRQEDNPRPQVGADYQCFDANANVMTVLRVIDVGVGRELYERYPRAMLTSLSLGHSDDDVDAVVINVRGYLAIMPVTTFNSNVEKGIIKQADMLDVVRVQGWHIGDVYESEQNGTRYTVVDAGTLEAMEHRYPEGELAHNDEYAEDSAIDLMTFVLVSKDDAVIDGTNVSGYWFETIERLEDDIAGGAYRRVPGGRPGRTVHADILDSPGVRVPWEIGDVYEYGSDRSLIRRDRSLYKIIDMGVFADVAYLYPQRIYNLNSELPDDQDVVWVSQSIQGSDRGTIVIDTLESLEKDLQSGLLRKTADALDLPTVRGRWAVGDQYVWISSHTMYTIVDRGMLNTLIKRYEGSGLAAGMA